MSIREIYLDIETQRLSDEVPGGWSNIPGFGMALAVTWETGRGFIFWIEGEEGKGSKELIEHLQACDRIITFNGERFDFKVLSAYGNVSAFYKRSFDLLALLEKELGHRVSLDSLARATLGRGKIGDGKEAVAWFRSGNKVMQERVLWYCQNDVELLRSVVNYGREHGVLFFLDRNGGPNRKVAYREDFEMVSPASPRRIAKRLILTVGLPRSGKTTWARQQGYPIVNRDAIRLALHGQAYIQEKEAEGTVIEDCMVKALFLAGHDTVIVDACHTTARRRDRWREIAEGWVIEERVFPVGAKVCAQRAVLDGRFDLLEVIERMAEATDVQEIREADIDCNDYPKVEERIGEL